MASNEKQRIPTAVPVDGAPEQTEQVAGGPQTSAPKYNTTPVSPELQMMDANKAGGESQVAKPQESGASVGTPGFEFIGGRRRFMIKQRFSMMEALAGVLSLGCVEFQNKYDVFDVNTNEHLLHAEEKSNTCIRCCCNPHHSAKLKVFDVTNGSAKATQPAMIVNKPFKLCCCPTLASICADEQSTVLGNGAKPIGAAKKHVPCGGCFSPQVDLTDSSGKKDGAIRGPFCCVGGLIELCQKINFNIMDASGANIGKLTKTKPQNMKAKVKEAVGDADMFFLELAASVSDEKTANIIATALLMDYIVFEGGSPVECNPLTGSMHCNCFTCYCGGCLCPCRCGCGGNNGSD